MVENRRFGPPQSKRRETRHSPTLVRYSRPNACTSPRTRRYFVFGKQRDCRADLAARVVRRRHEPVYSRPPLAKRPNSPRGVCLRGLPKPRLVEVCSAFAAQLRAGDLRQDVAKPVFPFRLSLLISTLSRKPPSHSPPTQTH